MFFKNDSIFIFYLEKFLIVREKKNQIYIQFGWKKISFHLHDFISGMILKRLLMLDYVK